MSRRGNCWDNAPQESFFGHMKDEIGRYTENAGSYEELKEIIDSYMVYYNNDRYQYNLAKLSPNEYLEYYMTSEYPLNHIAKEPDEYKEKFRQVKNNLDRNSTLEELVAILYKNIDGWIIIKYIITVVKYTKFISYDFLHSICFQYT